VGIVIPRSVWKPRHDNGFAVIGVGEWLAAGKEIWLHHSVTNPFGSGATLEQDCQHMRDFEQIGENRFGGGISYTWVIMPSGRVFEGHSIDRQGSHTYQRNNRARAICLAGNYDVSALPAVMERSAALLLRELGATIDGPHSAVYATACPGKYAAPRIGVINQLASSGAPIGDDDVNLTDSMENHFWDREKASVGDVLADTRNRVRNVEKAITELKTSGVPVDLKLSDADKEGIAELVAAKLAKRLES
jgi:hypothetical protein